MKHLTLLVLVVSILLVACSKPTPLTTDPPTDLYYKIVEVSSDGKTTTSETVHVRTETSKNGDEDQDEDDDDDDDDDDEECGTLSVTFTGVTAFLLTPTSVEVKWTVEDELNVLHYQVKKSTNSVDWKIVGVVAAGQEYKLINKVGN